MAQTKIDYRVMGDYSIAKSFKGILRIAHVMERVEGENDVFSNDVYYGAPISLMNISGSSSGSTQTYGHSSASEAFEGRVERYLSDKEYKNLKLPVTDSMGNYLNWNLGTEDSTIGSDMENNGISISTDTFYQTGYDGAIEQPVVFPVIESKELIVGLESKIHPSTTGGKIYFSSERLLELVNEEKNATLVISNLFDHSPENMEAIYQRDEEGVLIKDKFPKYKYKKAKYLDNKNDTKYRTIIRDTKSKIEEYDAFVYSQENYNVENFNYEHATQNNIEENSFSNVSKKSQIDAEVDVINLKDYVKDIIKKFMNSNVVEVPTGSVIYQYISPHKWYAHDDCGTGSILNNENCFIGHRPSMQLRNYETRMRDSSSWYSEINRWNSTTNQGACEKTNRLIIENGAKKEKGEDDLNDSSFDSSKLSEIIPLYKRDYILCDGSTYHIYLIENNNVNLDIRRKYSSFDRFFNLFYTIGYNYTIPVSESTRGLYNSPFSTIKTRYACKYVSGTQENEMGRYRFLNEIDEVIDENNAISTFGTKSGNPKEISWTDENMIKNLKDCETLYTSDMITMLAYKLLIEVDKKGAFEIKGKYNRNKAEEWLKNQKIPKEYIFNTFVGDTDDTFLRYKMTDEAKEVLEFDEENPKNKNYVMEMYYRHNKNVPSLKDCSMVYIGREVNSFNSVIKYFVPNSKGGEYVVCCAWQIPEIQYILDILIAGSGERNTILPKLFDYKFRVPNLTDTISPKFIGSTGFNWRDQKGNDLETENTWFSSISVGTSPHRHAVFKSLLRGFKTNDERPYFKGKEITSTSYIPSGSINYHTGDFPSGGKNGGAGKYVSDLSNSYIWNELGIYEGLRFGYPTNDDAFSGVDISSTYTLQRGNFHTSYMTKYPLFFRTDVGDGVTGTAQNEMGVDLTALSGKNKVLEKFTSFKNIFDKSGRASNNSGPASSKLGPPGTRFPKTGDFRNYKLTNQNVYEERGEIIKFPSPNETNIKACFDWYDSEVTKWYSFDISEDPRFNNAEPNRCITSGPIEYTISGFTYNKNELSAAGNTFSESYYFAPENVKMLPLIKL